MLHEPAERACLDRVITVLADVRLDGVNVAFEKTDGVTLDLVLTRSAILLAEEAAFSSVHFEQLITVDIV